MVEEGRSVGQREGAFVAAVEIKRRFDERAADRGIASPKKPSTDGKIIEGMFSDTPV